MNTGCWEINIHGCYSQVKITFAPVCMCKNNRQIWHNNASTLQLHDVTDQLWCHNAQSENTILTDNGEMSDQSFSRIAWSWQNIACKEWNDLFLTMNDNFLVALDVICQWFSQVTLSLMKSIGKSPHWWPQIVIHCNYCIILYLMLVQLISVSSKGPR